MPTKFGDIRSSELVVLPSDIQNINIGSIVTSSPPQGTNRVINLFVKEGKLEIQYDDQPDTVGTIISNPPVGSLKITNIYIQSGKLIIKYDNKL